MIRKTTTILVLCLILVTQSFAQGLEKINIKTKNTLQVTKFHTNKGKEKTDQIPLVSFRLDNKKVNTLEGKTVLKGDSAAISLLNKVEVGYKNHENYSPGWKGTVTIKNIHDDTLEVSNIVPFGTSPDRVYITGKGDHYLSRTHLFRPGYEPVNVIVPDNAWELGFSEINLNNSNICGIARRTNHKDGEIKRFVNILPPGASVTYTLWADTYQGNWQAGLRKIFQERYLYDVEPGKFDNSMYEREDLKWIRHTYASHLIMAWDKKFYDYETGNFNLDSFLKRGEKWYGGDDFIGLWPTWPSLGLDQRNQWDLFRDLPGGLEKLNDLATMSRSSGTKFFICYNPWDESTRSEDHFGGMANLIDSIGADGVVLDTRGSSSKELQKSADSVRDGVIMYSEGMAVPKDMQNIVSGRVHNAIYYPPILNLNKFIKPDFAIYRVAEISYERIRREYALSLFNGYGTELNIFPPGRPSWVEDDYRFFGKTLHILRENTHNFVSHNYEPLIPTLKDSIWVNKWPEGEKTVYTVFSKIPGGFEGPLFRVKQEQGYHFVDLWYHNEIEPDTIDGESYIPVRTETFHKRWLGTNNEGAVSAIAKLPELLLVKQRLDTLQIETKKGDSIKIWAGNPDYEKEALILPATKHSIKLTNKFGNYEGKFVIQLFRDDILIDERTATIERATPRLMSEVKTTEKAQKVPEGMVNIPEGEFEWKVSQGDEFIPYPKYGTNQQVHVKSFYMDKHPVTNAEFKKFMDATGYQPDNSSRFLRHWKNGKIPEGKEKYPVVNVSYEDAKAYAKWAGKRLPTEKEWQYAAQAGEDREWPWNQEKEVKREEEKITNTLTVYKLKGIDSTRCNTGSEEPYPVGKYPKGANPWGIEDLVGSVWQLTNDLYDNGAYRYIIMKGGSYYNPSSSWWYVQGGPRELHHRQMLLRVSQGFERNATVGFRCVKDKK